MDQPLSENLVSDRAAADPWIDRARPTFLYVMYTMLLAALPIGVLAAMAPDLAANATAGVRAYLNAIPEPLYVLFGTGYIGYTAARQWGKVAGVER